MKEIPLARGRIALVDEEDYGWLNQWKWYVHSSKSKFYVFRSVYRGRDLFTGKQVHKAIIMAREIMRAPDGVDVDHRDHNTLDNRRCNLRLATRSQNTANSLSPDHYKGICWRELYRYWDVQIQKDGKRVFLGAFKTKDEAAIAYNRAAKKLFGEFACLNQIMRHRNIKERESINQLI